MGDAKSLACHPAPTLHRQLTSEQKALAKANFQLESPWVLSILMILLMMLNKQFRLQKNN